MNDDSPLGLRRILSQSTDSLNFRNRAMSMESLNDEGKTGTEREREAFINSLIRWKMGWSEMKDGVERGELGERKILGM